MPEQPQDARSAARDRCECGADPGDINFDRSICACGSMHYFCNQCGTQAEPCSDEKPSAARNRYWIIICGRDIRVTRGMQRAWERLTRLLWIGCSTATFYPDDGDPTDVEAWGEVDH